MQSAASSGAPEHRQFAMSDGQAAPAQAGAVVTGPTYRFTVLTSRLIRMEWHERGQFVDERTQLVVNRDFPVPDFRVTELAGGGLEILTEHLQLRYDGAEFSSAGLSVTLTRGATDPHYSAWRYGFDYPQQLPYRGNLLGTARTLDEVDGATELEPGILATLGFAVVDDSDSVLLSSDGWIAARSASHTSPRQDLYLFGYGRDFSGALADYHRLTGPTPLVPRYVLGNWWSRYWPYSEDSYLTLMDRFEAERIPLSVAVIDMDWHLVDVDADIGTGWTGYTWNRDLFPDPQRFLTELHRRGLAVTLNVHPADGVRRHEEAYPEMARATGLDPDSGLPVAFDVTSREFVDAYLRYLHHPLEEQGVDFWWLDWQSGGVTAVAGLDPLWMLNHIHFLDSGRAGRRPLTFSRFAGLGSHRYPVGFSGDTIISWASLDFQPYFTATAANVGYTWWSHDIGGHMFGARDVELTVRWFQYGVFSPVNRLHSSASAFTSKEPWSYGPSAQGIIGRFLRLRHRLVPALYTAAWSAHTAATAVVRPMYHDYPSLQDAYTVPNQAMLGEHLLVAPLTTPRDQSAGVAAVTAWLPPGAWFDLFSGHRYAGDRRVVLHRPLETYPVLARAGSVLVLAADPAAPVDRVPTSLQVRVFPGDGVSHLVEDHGQAAPTAAEANEIRIEQSLVVHHDGGADLTLVLSPPSGPDPVVQRTVVLDIVGALGLESMVITRGEGAGDGNLEAAAPESSWGEVAVHRDELLSPALRIPLGSVDLSSGLRVRLRGLRPVADQVVQDAFDLLDRAEIRFLDKENAWRAVNAHRGLDLAQELATVPLPSILRDVILEVAGVQRPW